MKTFTLSGSKKMPTQLPRETTSPRELSRTKSGRKVDLPHSVTSFPSGSMKEALQPLQLSGMQVALGWEGQVALAHGGGSQGQRISGGSMVTGKRRE